VWRLEHLGIVGGAFFHILDGQFDLPRQGAQGGVGLSQFQRLAVEFQGTVQVMFVFHAPRCLHEGADFGGGVHGGALLGGGWLFPGGRFCGRGGQAESLCYGVLRQRHQPLAEGGAVGQGFARPGALEQVGDGLAVVTRQGGEQGLVAVTG
jgi:hypothetical protein